MVEEARDIRDRGYLAINLLLGGIAVAVGLFNMFVLHNFGPASMFDAFLGMSMITVGSLFIAPYMAPRQLGLPSPGVRMERRPYLPYPVPLPVEEGEEEEPVPVPEVEEELPMLPSPVRRPAGVAARPIASFATTGARAPSMVAAPRRSSRPVPSAEAANTIAELDALGVGTGTSSRVSLSPPPGLLHLPPFLPEQPPPADYLEEAEPLPSTIPELEPQFQRALEELAGAAGRETNGAHPLVLVNGKPPETTLSILEEVLRQPPPFGEEGSEPSVPSTTSEATSASTSPGEPISEVDHLERDLESLPRVGDVHLGPPGELRSAFSQPTSELTPGGGSDGSLETSAPATFPQPRMEPVQEVSGPPAESEGAPLAPTPEPPTALPVEPQAWETSEVRPAPQSTPGPAAAVSAPLSAEQAMNMPEGELEQMAKALEGMVSALREFETEPAPKHEVEPPAAAIPPPVGATSGAPSEASETPPAPESFSEDSEPAPAIDDLERQLAAMRSALAQDAPRPLPPPVSNAARDDEGRTSLPILPLPSAEPVERPPSADSTEEDLQRVLEEVHSAAKLTQDRHTGREKKRKK